MANNTTCTSYAISIHVFFCLPHLENLVDLFRRKLDVFICRITIAAIFYYSLNAYCETPGPSYKKQKWLVHKILLNDHRRKCLSKLNVSSTSFRTNQFLTAFVVAFAVKRIYLFLCVIRTLCLSPQSPLRSCLPFLETGLKESPTRQARTNRESTGDRGSLPLSLVSALSYLRSYKS